MCIYLIINASRKKNTCHEVWWMTHRCCSRPPTWSWTVIFFKLKVTGWGWCRQDCGQVEGWRRKCLGKLPAEATRLASFSAPRLLSLWLPHPLTQGGATAPKCSLFIWLSGQTTTWSNSGLKPALQVSHLQTMVCCFQVWITPHYCLLYRKAAILQGAGERPEASCTQH